MPSVAFDFLGMQTRSTVTYACFWRRVWKRDTLFIRQGHWSSTWKLSFWSKDTRWNQSILLWMAVVWIKGLLWGVVSWPILPAVASPEGNACSRHAYQEIQYTFSWRDRQDHRHVCRSRPGTYSARSTTVAEKEWMGSLDSYEWRISEHAGSFRKQRSLGLLSTRRPERHSQYLELRWFADIQTTSKSVFRSDAAGGT